MKDISLLIILFFIFSCKEVKKNISLSKDIKEKEYLISENKDTIIGNISKSCRELQERDIHEYYLCREWKIPNEIEIRKILKSGELGDGEEGDSRTLHYAASELPMWITADMSIGNRKYKIKINGGSYFYITNQENKTSLYFCKNRKYRNFFISAIGVDDDEIYERLKIKIFNQIKTQKTDISSWKGNYNFDNGNYEQGYRNYHIKIEKDDCFFYQGNLPACMIDCIAFENDNELLLYIKSNEFRKSEYDISLIESLEEGDFLLKIFKIKNKYFIKSALIKYWDDKKEKFNENINIEAIKK